MIKYSRGSGLRTLIFLVFVVAVLVAAGFVLTRSGPEPTIAIEPAAKVIGRKTPVTIRVDEPKRGIGPVRVELIQGDAVQRLAESNNPVPPAWKFWSKGKTNETIQVNVGKEAVKDLKAGTAIIRVTAERIPAVLRHPQPVVTQVELPVRLVPPTVQVMSTFTYVSQGGAEAVVYRVGETATRDGVRAGTRFFPGYPLPGGGARDRFALFSVPYDMDEVSSVKVIASDDAGNESEVGFIEKFFAKPLRRDTIALSDAFMQKVTTEIMSQTPELADKGNVLDNYLQINRELRKKNNAFIVGLTAKTKQEFLWKQPFLPMVNTAIKAHFADRRSYVYNDKSVDEQDHLGLDMASTKADNVPASNDGIIVFAGYLGIYGNCVVIDHGYGLQTLYGHLSSIAVKEGDKIARGQALGRSGATGLAGGDHLHFAVMLDGLPVSPIEWFDAKWIRDRLKLKLGNALPFNG